VLAAIVFPNIFPMQSILAVYNCASSGKTD
jgi:hypothetical protein